LIFYLILISLFLIIELENNNFENTESKKHFEYSTYLITASLLSIEFDDFEKYFKLLNLVEKDNYFYKD
jgi:hypothetical protein